MSACRMEWGVQNGMEYTEQNGVLGENGMEWT